MSLLSLRDIGKIYVSDSNVAVGIRGVSLDFERGEFVAVTGKSGSGKSTLLNVISGMDSYEEGELLIEGSPTSHYSQADWEKYRQQYISFIFQDYNIIDSFTVLQNVELALMDIRDRRERRKRALELIRRVGLSDKLHSKGSKLSGGQKQRTVIARALAKDSPIILADEPTGNLDSESAAEIIRLLKEVSQDKLLIVVTHNFEQVEKFATRHIRVYDGAVEADQLLRAPEPVSNGQVSEAEDEADKRSFLRTLSDGITLGWAIFTARPMLSFFLCLFMTVGAFGIFAVTSLCNFSSLFEKAQMFEPYEGRVILSDENPARLSDDQLKILSEKTGAYDFLHYDYLLDRGDTSRFKLFYGPTEADLFLTVSYSFESKPSAVSVGRYPTGEREILLVLPISMQDQFGKDSLRYTELRIGSWENPLQKLTVTGISYFLDNTRSARIVFTHDGFFSLSKELGKDSEKGYCQATLFYKNNAKASQSLSALKEEGYLAVMSDETYTPPAIETVLNSISLIGLLILWVITVIFLAFFINLCTARSMASFQNDLGILRSMGIPVRTIRLSIFVRMFLAMLIALLVMLITARLIYTSPTLNPKFTYLPVWNYLLIAAGMILLTVRITHKQIKKLFGESVKKTIQGGDSK